MKYFTFLFGILFAFSTWANVQSTPVKYKRQDSDHIKEILKAWDANKGDYLYESIAAMVMHSEQPERPRGVNQTPFEMLQTMDKRRIERLNRVADQELENEKNATRGKRDAYYWQEWQAYVNSTQCSDMNKGQSNGDPHMTTFDGEKYDFQNAGDYLLTGTDKNTFMIQTQMIRTNSNISQNGAVAMNVNGDVVEFRSEETKDGGMIFINGQEMLIENTDFVLPQGGVIQQNSRRVHKVKWPTGEQALVRNRGSKMNRLFDVTVYVPECNQDQYYGLLGNNDGVRDNDLDASEQTEEQRLLVYGEESYEDVFGPNRRNPDVISRVQNKGRYISHDFGDQFMLSASTSLFSNQMVNIPDSVRYPSEHLSLAELSDEQIEEGLRKAQKAGFEDEDLFAAVYDYGHIGLEPELYENEGYERPAPENKYTEPVLDNQGDRTGSSQTTNEPVKVDRRVNIGTGVIITPPRPIYRPNPRRTRPTSSPGTNTNRRTPDSSGSSTRTPQRGGR